MMYEIFLLTVLTLALSNAKSRDIWDERETKDCLKKVCSQTTSIPEFEGLCDEFHPPQNFYESPQFRKPNEMTYHFYSQKHPTGSFDVKLTNIDLLRFSDFDPHKETLFIIHGWKNHNESEVNYHIRETILEDHNINVFVVDWSPMAGRNYVSARNSVVRVGEYVADFIRILKNQFGLKLSLVKFVGYSLGAHVSGNAGAALGGKVDRIVGLDPAGPLFTKRNIHNRLDPTDAKLVLVIHTCGGWLGFGSSIGHADYYPNGGTSQPGCGWDLAGSCAHARAYSYYAESLRPQYRYVAKRCSSYSDYDRGRCDHEPTSLMGRFAADYKARGDYYLKTNSQHPFARG